MIFDILLIEKQTSSQLFTDFKIHRDESKFLRNFDSAMKLNQVYIATHTRKIWACRLDLGMLNLESCQRHGPPQLKRSVELLMEAWKDSTDGVVVTIADMSKREADEVMEPIQLCTG